MTDRGIVYRLSGVSYAELLAVSLWSLRKHCDLPATIFVTDGQCALAANRLADDKRLRCKVELAEMPDVRRHASYVLKPRLTAESPYDQTIFLDADTVVTGPLDELFTAPLAITRFCDWVSTGRIISGRIRQWTGLSPMVDGLVERSCAVEYPAINTGVFAWHKDFPGLPAWRRLTREGWKRSFTDELAMQLLFPEWTWTGCRVFPASFNCSAKFGKDFDKARVIHFHGRSHIRKTKGGNLTLANALWWPHFEEARAANAGGLAEWAGTCDKAGVRGRLQELAREARSKRLA